jgi:hypothetical protein
MRILSTNRIGIKCLILGSGGAEIAASMELSEQQQRILAWIGVALVLLQTTEKIINLCLTFVFQKGSPLTLEDLERQQKKERKKTIGYFLGELRKRVDLDAKFDQTLRDFLNYRNIFIHNLDYVPGWDFDTPNGRQAAWQFISELNSLTETVLLTFSGFVRAWEKQIGMNAPIPSGSEHVILWIDRVYTPLIHELVFKKDT